MAGALLFRRFLFRRIQRALSEHRRAWQNEWRDPEESRWIGVGIAPHRCCGRLPDMACGDVAWTGKVFCAKAGGQHAARANQTATAAWSAHGKYQQCRVGSLKVPPSWCCRVRCAHSGPHLVCHWQRCVLYVVTRFTQDDGTIRPVRPTSGRQERRCHFREDLCHFAVELCHVASTPPGRPGFGHLQTGGPTEISRPAQRRQTPARFLGQLCRYQ